MEDDVTNYSVRRCPIEKSARVRNLFATGLDDVWVSYAVYRTLRWLSIDVTIIAIRPVFKDCGGWEICTVSGEMCVFGDLRVDLNLMQIY